MSLRVQRGKRLLFEALDLLLAVEPSPRVAEQVRLAVEPVHLDVGAVDVDVLPVVQNRHPVGGVLDGPPERLEFPAPLLALGDIPENADGALDGLPAGQCEVVLDGSELTACGLDVELCCRRPPVGLDQLRYLCLDPLDVGPGHSDRDVLAQGLLAVAELPLRGLVEEGEPARLVQRVDGVADGVQELLVAAERRRVLLALYRAPDVPGQQCHELAFAPVELAVSWLRAPETHLSVLLLAQEDRCGDVRPAVVCRRVVGVLRTPGVGEREHRPRRFVEPLSVCLTAPDDGPRLVAPDRADGRLGGLLVPAPEEQPRLETEILRAEFEHLLDNRVGVVCRGGQLVKIPERNHVLRGRLARDPGPCPRPHHGTALQAVSGPESVEGRPQCPPDAPGRRRILVVERLAPGRTDAQGVPVAGRDEYPTPERPLQFGVRFPHRPVVASVLEFVGR